jgi:hypothetical protein
MQTVNDTTANSKPRPVFYAHLNDEEGTLAMVDETVYFFNPDTGNITVVTSYAGLTVLGEVGLSDTQRLMDELHSGLAWIATHRQNVEV